MARGVITLTTDFGFHDHYVAVMKGVILGIAPDVTLVDISHDVPPQAVAGGAYLLQNAHEYFPAGTVHLAVVDPGVGTARLPIAVATPRATFVGPDNGLFAPLLIQQEMLDPATGELTGARAVSLAEARYRRPAVSNTFHGRDIFAPAAAHLARGVAVSELGPRVTHLAVPRSAVPEKTEYGARGTIVHIDHFGNAVTNIPGEWLGASVAIDVGQCTLHGLSASYQDREQCALIGSGGLLEIAVRNGSAAARMGLAIGDVVVVRNAP